MAANGSATPAQGPPPSLPYEELEITVSVVVYSLLSLLIIVGNGLVIMAFRYNPRLQTATNTFLVWLAVSDLLVGFVAVPLWIYYSSCQQYNSCTSSDALLVFYAAIDIFTGSTSILQLTSISVERYIAITRPLSHRTYSLNLYRGMILWAWLLSFVMASLYPVQFYYRWKDAYSITLATTCFALPTVVIIAVYAVIFKTAKIKSQCRVHSTTTVSSARRRQQNETKIAGTIAVITGLFVVAWTPFFVVNLVAQFCADCLPAYPEVLRLIRFVKWMHYSNSVINPCIYTYRNKEMRKTFARLLRACLCCRGNVWVETSSSVRSQGLGRNPALNLAYEGMVDGGSNTGSRDTQDGVQQVPFATEK